MQVEEVDTADSPGNPFPPSLAMHVRQRRWELSERLRQQSFPDPCVLEIGCGHGHYLNAYAENHPGHFCIGVDRMKKRLEKANRKKDLRRLQNLLFYRAEAVEFLQCLPPIATFRRIFVLFADPWPKKRHWKNRLLQDSHLGLLATVSRPGATLHFRTDDASYFSWVQENIARHPRWQAESTLTWPFECATIFQSYTQQYHSLSAVLQEGPP